MLHELTTLIGSVRCAACAVALNVLLIHDAAAATPTVPECLAASDASLQAGNERKRLAERDQLLICAQASCPKVVREECERRLEEVNQRMATVVFDVRDAQDRPLTAVTVLIDGRVLSASVNDEPVPVDPGEHQFQFRIAGQAELSRSVTIREAEKDRQIRVQIQNGATGEQGAAAPPSPPEKNARLQRTLALASAGLAVAGVGVGTVFGLTAWSQRNEARDACPEACADRAGVDAWADARRSGNFATVSFVVAGVASAAAATLWFTLPNSSATSTRVGLGPGSAVLTGAF